LPSWAAEAFDCRNKQIDVKGLGAHCVGPLLSQALQPRCQLGSVASREYSARLGLGLPRQVKYRTPVAVGEPQVDEDYLETVLLGSTEAGAPSEPRL
jgi:hypothetical protein